jgi:hypothetical protein
MRRLSARPVLVQRLVCAVETCSAPSLLEHVHYAWRITASHIRTRSHHCALQYRPSLLHVHATCSTCTCTCTVTSGAEKVTKFTPGHTACPNVPTSYMQPNSPMYMLTGDRSVYPNNQASMTQPLHQPPAISHAYIFRWQPAGLLIGYIHTATVYM